jgi:hypothetical protein
MVTKLWVGDSILANFTGEQVNAILKILGWVRNVAGTFVE